ncbi:hypothetical protein Hanom_Chr00s000007g01615731 [Helianthus anomalus]
MRLINKNPKSYLDIICLAYEFKTKSILLLHFFGYNFLVDCGAKMLSFWRNNYFGKQYSNDLWGVNDANEEEEVVSGIPVDQKIQFPDLNGAQLPDLNKAPTPPVDEPYYPAHQVYLDYGYGCESSYVQQGNPDGYGGYGDELVDEPYYPAQQSYTDYSGYGDDYPAQQSYTDYSCQT